MVTTERLPPRTIWADVKRSRRPAPNALSRPDGPRSTAPCTRTVSSSSTVSAGLRDLRTATAPVTWGVAMEVPPKTMYPPGTEERMLSPGALTSGLTDPSQGEGPWPLKKPQELFTTSGALAGSPPGARNHWKISWKTDVKPKPRSFQALAAIH